MEFKRDEILVKHSLLRGTRFVLAIGRLSLCEKLQKLLFYIRLITSMFRHFDNRVVYSMSCRGYFCLEVLLQVQIFDAEGLSMYAERY